MKRDYTVTCLAPNSQVFYLSREDFRTKINNPLSGILILAENKKMGTFFKERIDTAMWTVK
jgi:hypothetical protein